MINIDIKKIWMKISCWFIVSFYILFVIRCKDLKSIDRIIVVDGF